MMKQLEPVDTWFLRLMLRISWTDKVTNEVLHGENIDRKLLKYIVSRQMKFFGYVVRKKELVNLGVTNLIEGR